MQRIKVKSSNIVSVGYDEKEKIMEVEFISSGVYKYYEVSKEIYENFLKSESKGKYLFAHIRGRYRYEKL